jgi:PAS domain-containing protein
VSSQGRSGADESRTHQPEEEHPATFELAGVGTAQADPATARLLRVNPKLCEITGYSKEELLGMLSPRSRTLKTAERTLRASSRPYAVRHPSTKPRSATCARTDKSCGLA